MPGPAVIASSTVASSRSGVQRARRGGLGDDEPVARQEGARGVGLTVALLWGVSVQLIAQGLSHLAGSTLFAAHSGRNGSLAAAASFFGGSVAAAFGEAVRRGHERSRKLAVALAAALTVAGLVSLPRTLADLRRGFIWPSIPTLVLLTIAPLIAVWMHSSRSRAWFAATTSEDARVRHGGVWPFVLAAIAVASGLLVAYAEARHR